MASSRVMVFPHAPGRAISLALLSALVACGPSVRRDLTAIPQRQITYDDLCGLQTYFDQRAAAHAPPFRVVDEQSVETSRMEADERGTLRPVVVGEGTYVVRDRTDRLQLRRLLRQEYHRLPNVRLLGRDAEVRVHVRWWRSGSIRRLIPEEDIELSAEGERYELPHAPCVGEFLFGDLSYAMRRNVLSAERARAHGELPSEYLGDAALEPALSPDAASTAADPAPTTPDAGPSTPPSTPPPVPFPSPPDAGRRAD